MEETPKLTLVQKAKNFIIPKLKFASTSLVASTVDTTLHMVLVKIYGFSPEYSYAISASCGMLINFFLQKRFIFSLNRRTSTAFIMSVSFSLIGIGLGILLIHLLTLIPFFNNNQLLAKLSVQGTIFLYNFYTKRFAFEKKIDW